MALMAAAGGPWAAMAQTAPASVQHFPDVVAVRVSAVGKHRFNVDVTVSSPYDTPDRYADGIRARTREGTVLGERKLLHDHASEQPFTRDINNVVVPAGVTELVIEARDQRHGYGGKTVVVKLPGR